VVKIMPLGSGHAFQPYVGGGLGVYFWRYSETGEFLATDESIFSDSFVQSGTSIGPVAVFGVRGLVSPSALIGVEGRYSGARPTCQRTSWATNSISAGSAFSRRSLPLLIRSSRALSGVVPLHAGCLP